MKREGTAFIIIVGALGAMSGTFGILLGTAAAIGSVFAALRFGTNMLNNKAERGWQSGKEIRDVGYRFDTCTIPAELKRIKQALIAHLSYTDNAPYDVVVDRFLAKIHVTTPPGQRPNYLFDAITKKMMWEFKNKYGMITVPRHFRNFLTIDEIVRPIAATDMQSFHNFCMQTL